MAISISNLTNGASTSRPASTASVSPSSGSGVLLAVGMALASGYPTDALAVSGCGLTWTKLGTQTWTARRRLWIYVGTGTVTSGSISITHDNAYQVVGWIVDEVTGLDHTTPQIGTAGSWGDNNSNGFVTSAADATGTVAAGDATYSALQLEQIQTIGADQDESGYTFLASGANDTNGIRMMATSWLLHTGDGDKGCTWDWTGGTSAGSGTINVLLAQATSTPDVTVTVDPVSVAVAELAPTQSSSVTVQAGPTAVAISEQAPAQSSDVSTQVGPVTVSAAELAPTQTSSTLIQAAPVAATVTELAPSQSSDVSAQVDTVAITTTELAPSQSSDVSSTVGPVPVTVTELAPTQISTGSVLVEVDPVSVTIAELTPAQSSDVSTQVGPVAVTVAELAPAQSSDTLTSVGVVEVALTELSPTVDTGEEISVVAYAGSTPITAAYLGSTSVTLTGPG